jgi:hypothetical protein
MEVNIHAHCRVFQYVTVYVFRNTEIFIGLLGLLAFIFCPTVVAQERNGWKLDSL